MSHPSFKYLGKIAVVAIVYFAFARLGLWIDAVGGIATPIWAPTGISLAVLLLYGCQVCPGIALGAFLANYSVGETFPVALGISIGNTLEAVLGATLLNRWAQFRPSLERLRDVLGLIIFAAVLSTLVSASIGVTSGWLGGSIAKEDFLKAWWTWWVGDMMGDLIIAPVLLVWGVRWAFRFDLRKAVEAVALLCLMVITIEIVFARWLPGLAFFHERPYLVFPFLIWAALRFNQRGVTLAILIVSVLSIWQTAQHFLYQNTTLHENLLSLQIFLGVVAVTTLILAAVVSERKQVEERIRRNTEQDLQHQKALLELAKMDYSDVLLALQRITEKDAQTLQVERVSVWLFSKDRSEIFCEDLYTMSKNRHERGLRILAQQYPKYFQALEESLTIAANNASKDVRTSEFATEYLIPNRITSMMDVPIRFRGKVIGIVCHEHTGSEREWNLEEQDFAASVADMVSLTFASAERKEGEEKLKRSNEELQRVSQKKSEFASIVSHELRSPLTVIKEGIGIVLDGIDGPVTDLQKETLGLARDNVDRLSRLINNVLDYEKLESGKMELSFAKTNLNHLITDVYYFMQMAAKKRKIDLAVEIPKKPLYAACDADMMKEVVINLLDNALKFTGRGGKIKVRLNHENASIKIEVEDNGIGIKPEDQSRIFEMFSQASSRSSLRIGGSGIGLAVCKLIVAEHKGQISVSSELGKGTRFQVLIPTNLNV